MQPEKDRNNALFQAAHMMILVSYTIFSVVLIGESLLLSWEGWAIPLVTLGVLFSWGLHIMQTIPEEYRLWIYSVLMMTTFFFYGIHETSMYDIAPVMAIVIMLYGMTGVPGLVLLCMGAYYVTMLYDVAAFALRGGTFDPLTVTRILLHLLLVFMAGAVARMIIKKWGQVLERTETEIADLKEATRRVDDFLANVSHEIRTPINAVIGLTGVMADKTQDEELRGELHAVGDAGRRVAEQIGDILDYTELDMKKLAVTSETYMVDSLVNDLAVQVKMLMRPSVELIFDVDATVPAALVGDAVKLKKILWHLVANGLKFTREGGVRVRICAEPRDYGINLCIVVTDTGVGMSEEEIDRTFDRFYQTDSGRSRAAGGLGLGIPIVGGFAESMGGFFSVKSEPGRGTTASVSIPQTISDATPCMSLEDRQGMCAAAFFRFAQYTPQVREFYHALLEHISRELKLPIHRVNDLSELKKLQRTGRLTHLLLGALEYREDPGYIELLTDTVQVAVVADDTFRRGEDSAVRVLSKPISTFALVNMLKMQTSSGESGEDDGERIYCPGVRALVVDDERMNLMVAEGIFKSYGMTVSTVTSGPEAIALCRKETFDVIFMDHMMPEMDGVEAMKRIRADAGRKGAEIVMIALTANAVSSARDMFLSEGFNGFVPKPIELSELERVLKRELPKSMIRYEKQKRGHGGRGNPRRGKEGYAILQTAGIRTDDGLRYCMDDRDFYRSLLLEYGQSAAAKREELERFYEEKNWKDYAIRVHALKSTSRMIGAEELSELSRRLEEAAKGERTGTIAAEHKKLLTLMQETADAILAAFGEGAQTAGTDGDEEIMEFLPEGEAEEEVPEFAPPYEEGGLS